MVSVRADTADCAKHDGWIGYDLFGESRSWSSHPLQSNTSGNAMLPHELAGVVEALRSGGSDLLQALKGIDATACSTQLA